MESAQFPSRGFVTRMFFTKPLNTLQLNPEISTVCWLTPLTEEDEMSLYRYFKSVVVL